MPRLLRTMLAQQGQGRRTVKGCNKPEITVKECLKTTASAGIGPALPLARIALSYHNACIAMRERMVLGTNVAISFMDPFRGNGREEAGFADDPELERRLQIAVGALDGPGAERAAEEMLTVLLEPLATVAEVEECVLYLSSLLIRIIRENGWTVGGALGEDAAEFRRLGELATKEHISRWLKKAVRRVIGCGLERRVSTTHELIRRAQELLEERMHEHIGLQQLSGELHINSSYLSRLFKKHTGLTYSQYVQKMKMEMARALLRQGLKASVVAEQLGYYDDSYFTKVVRKFWGAPPSAAH